MQSRALRAKPFGGGRDTSRAPSEIQEEVSKILAEDSLKLRKMESDGIVRCLDGRLQVTFAGRYFIGTIAALFDAYLDKNGNTGFPVLFNDL